MMRPGRCFPLLLLLLMTPEAALATPDEILVTAAKRLQAAEESPASISVISGAEARKASAFASAEEITQLLAGVQAAVANGNQIAFQVRGIGAVDHQALTPTAAAVYADGVFLATNVQTGPLLYDLDRIEVLKGPQGSLYGRNAASGAINFITVRPGEEQEGYLGWSYGRFDRVDVAGAIGGPLSGDVSGRLAGRYLSEDAALDNVRTDPSFPKGPRSAGGERREFGLRGTVSWEGQSATLLSRVHYEEDNGVNPAPRNLGLGLERHQISVGGDGVQDTDNEFYGAAIEAEAALGAWELFSLSAFEGYNQQYGFDFDGTPAPFGVYSLNANLSYDRNFSQWSEELRALREWRLGHVMIGAMAAREKFSQEYLIWCGALDSSSLLGDCPYVGAPGRVGPHPASPGAAFTLITQIEQKRTTAALFTYNDVEITDALTFTFGARFTHETIDGMGSGRHIFNDGVIAYNNRDGLGPAIGGARIRENRVSGNAAFSFRFSEEAMVYASFSNGYKSGGFNGEVQNNATHFEEQGLFAAETVNAYELGYKGNPAPGLAASAAFFYQDYQAPQARIFVNFPLPDGSSIISNSLSNLDEAQAYGLEAEIDWRLSERFSAGGAVTLLQTKIRQTTNAGGNAAIFDGNPLPFASEVSAVAFGRYERPIGAGARVALQGNAKYQSAFYLDAEGRADRRQHGYTIVDAEAALHFDKVGFEMAVWGRNLLNEDYAVSGFGFIGYNVFLGPPRTYGVRMRKAF